MALNEDNDALRRLARAVMAGETSIDEYRRQRTLVIDRLAGEMPVKTSPGVVPKQPPVISPSTQDDTHPSLPPATIADKQAAAGHAAKTAGQGGGHDLWIGVGAVALVLLIVGGLLAYFWR